MPYPNVQSGRVEYRRSAADHRGSLSRRAGRDVLEGRMNERALR